MRWRTQLWIVLALVLLASVATLLSLRNRLPEIVATHFGIDGRADGSMSRSGFIVFLLAMQFGMTALFGGLALLLPRLPTAMINLPNKAYWLAEPRRATTLACLHNSMLAMGIATCLLLLGLGLWTAWVNRQEEVRLGSEFWWVLGSYGGFVVVWSVVFIGRFARLPK